MLGGSQSLSLNSPLKHFPNISRKSGNQISFKSPSEQENRDEQMRIIFDNIIKILKESKKDERIIVPMFKMVDAILDMKSVQTWDKLHEYEQSFLDIITSETAKTKSIFKVHIISLILRLFLPSES